MENLQAMQTSREDGWPYVQHEFFPGQGFKEASQSSGQMNSVSRPLGASATAEPPHWIWEDFSGVGAGNGNTAGSKHWRDSWEWDSVSFTAQQRETPSCLANTNRSPYGLEDQQFKSSSPSDKSEANMSHNESMSLELGLNNTLVEADGLLDLKLGGKGYAYGGGDLTPSVKRSRHSPPEIQHPRCQVDNCTADLKDAKDYHRRHKVCEVHAKALKAPVSRIMQRFCQQCSRFHLLQEFDEDRRSCRRRLAGHNRRRRKTQPDATAALAYLLADQNPLARLINPLGQDQGKVELERLLSLFGSGNALLPALLSTKAPGDTEIRSNLMGGSTNDVINAYTKSQLLSSLLLSNPSLVSKLQSVVPVDSSLSTLSNALLQLLQENYSKTGISSQQESVCCVNEAHTNVTNVDLCLERKDDLLRGTRFEHTPGPCPTSSSLHQGHTVPHQSIVRGACFDNNTSNGLPNAELNGRRFLDHGHCLRDEQGDGRVPANTQMPGLNFLREPSAIQHPETVYQHTDPLRIPLDECTETAAPGSDQSSDSGLDKQEHTFQIWFKIFDRGPEDLPSTLRNQMLEWLEHLPTEMEGFIRPGCIILTVYIRMPLLAWKKLYQDTESSLLKLVSSTSSDFWRRSRVFVQLGGASAFIIEGKVFLNAQLKPSPAPHLLLVRPFAIIVGESANFSIRGYNLKAPSTKVICAYDGKSVDKEVSLLGAGESKRERDNQGVDCTEEQDLTFNMGPMDAIGHGFIEVESKGSKGNVFPFLVAEKSICEEVSLLEEEFEKSPQVKEASGSVHFLYEMGWLLERRKWRISHRDLEIQEFSAARYRWLLRFAMEHNWRAVVKKILDLLFSTDDHEQAGAKALETLSEVHLMHIAVRNNSRMMVEMLAAYSPPTRHPHLQEQYIFRPDTPGPGGLTPLHIAASMHCADEVIDCLTNFPKELWATTWTNGKDSVGQTPLGYALASDNCVYVRLVQDKLQKRRVDEVRSDVSHGPAHTAVTIIPTGDEKVSTTYSSPSNRPFTSSKIQPCSCRHGGLAARSHGLSLKLRGLNGAVYRPFVLSMLAVAAVCVCVGVLMKGPPNVYFVQPPFVWEYIDFGFI